MKLFIDKQSDIFEFVLTHVELGAEVLVWGDDIPQCMAILGDLTFEDIDHIRFIEYEEGSNHCVVVFWFV